MKREAWALAVVVALGVGALAWLRWRGSDRGPGSTAEDVARLSEERTRLRDDLRELLTASDVLDFAQAPPGNVLVGVPTSFTKKLVSQLLTGLFSEVRLHLTNLKAHHEDDVKARVLFAQRTVGHFVLDVDIKEIRAVLRPGEPELHFGGDKIHIKLPVMVAEGRGSASVRFQWNGKGIAGAVCGDLDVSPDVSSDVAPATYTVEGDFLLSAEGDTVVGKPRFGEVVLRVRLLPSEKTWATLAAAVADVKEDKNGICGMALQKVDIKAIVQKVIDKGFAVKLPAKLFREIALPAVVEQSVTFKGHTVSLDARPLGLHVSESMLWYGVVLGAQANGIMDAARESRLDWRSPLMAIDTQVLQNVAVFQLLDQEELMDLLAETEERSYVAGQTIFREGQPGGEMHVILDGRVETFLVDDEGHRVILAELQKGEMFGELSLFDNEPRSASAVALEPTRTCIVDRKDLEHLFARKPPAALDILAVLSRRLRKTDQLLSQRVAKNPNVVIEEESTLGQRMADGVARVGGSWAFINVFTVIMVGWMGLNLFWLSHPFDPAPFIGLNLVLSMMAALQAPVIMMSQNRQDTKDRVRADLDYQVNLKAEIEIMDLHKKVDRMKDELMELLIMVRDGRK